MWFELLPVEIDFLDSARRRWVVEARLEAPRSVVWEAFSDPTTWVHWFPGVREATYPNATLPYGVGTRRFSRVGRQLYEETMLAWEERKRFAYRIDRTTLPLSKSHVECTDFEDDGEGTRIRWTLAAEPRLMLRLTSPFMERILEDLINRAAKNLDRYLRVPEP